METCRTSESLKELREQIRRDQELDICPSGLTDPAPGTCEECGRPTPMRGIEKCARCCLARDRRAMADPTPFVPTSMWKKKEQKACPNSA